MYKAFFKLLAQQAPRQALKQCQQHLEALLAFIQLDIAMNFEHQLALKQLGACERQVTDVSVALFLPLIYNYIDCLHNGGGAVDAYQSLAQNYAETCAHLNNFLTEKCNELAATKCLTDVLVTISMLLTKTMDHRQTFQCFWKQLKGVAVYVAHFDLISACIRLAPQIHETKLTSWQCCTSVRKHTILVLAQIAIFSYENFVQQVPEQQAFTEAQKYETLNQQIMLILRQAMKTIKSMSCAEYEIKCLYVNFELLACSVVSSVKRAQLCLALAELFALIKEKSNSADWLRLLRRCSKLAALTEDAKLKAELLSCYAAALACSNAPQDAIILRSLVADYYDPQSGANKPQKCLLQHLQTTKHAFKTQLQAQQQCQLHQLETFYISKYHKTNSMLQSSIMQHSSSEYELVLLARSCGTLQAEAMTQLVRIYDTLCRTISLSRLQWLTLAHATLFMWQNKQQKNKQKLFETSNLSEDKLCELLQHKAFESVNIDNEMKSVSLALRSLHFFQNFFDQMDEELISSDEALLHWEAILADISCLALYFQSAGFEEHAMNAWLLHYTIAKLLQDQYSMLRSFSYFCENVERMPTVSYKLNMQQELAYNTNLLLQALPKLPYELYRHQHVVLIGLCQLAFYYSHNSQHNYAQMLLAFVRQTHAANPERLHKYDVVLATLDAVRFRILWKHLHIDSSAEHLLTQGCLIRNLDAMLEAFRNLAFISSTDSPIYTNLLYNLVLEIAQCTANRLTENIVSGYMSCVLKTALNTGAALRVVQLLSVWMWINLQMEYVDKAQLKLNLIKCIMGEESIEALKAKNQKQTHAMQSCSKQATKSTTATTTNFELQQLSNEMQHLLLTPGMQMSRKMQQENTPMLHKKLMRSPTSSAGCRDLQNYFNYFSSNHLLRDNELLQWTYLKVACLHARLNFLLADYEQLSDFYERCFKWLQQRHTKMLLQQFQYLQLLIMQHYANYLRALGRHAQAQQCVESALQQAHKAAGQVDTVYYINFIVQLRATNIEILKQYKQPNEVQSGSGAAKLRQNENPTRRILFGSNALAAQEAMPRTNNTASSKLKAITNAESSAEDAEDAEEAEDLNACQIIDISDDSDEAAGSPLLATQTNKKPAAIVVIKEKAATAAAEKQQPVATKSSKKLLPSRTPATAAKTKSNIAKNLNDEFLLPSDVNAAANFLDVIPCITLTETPRTRAKPKTPATRGRPRKTPVQQTQLTVSSTEQTPSPSADSVASKKMTSSSRASARKPSVKASAKKSPSKHMLKMKAVGDNLENMSPKSVQAVKAGSASSALKGATKSSSRRRPLT